MCAITFAQDTSFIEANTELTKLVAAGVQLNEVLDFVYVHFGRFIPFERIGFSLIDEETNRVRARWARSQFPVCLKNGFSAPLHGSSLEFVLERRCPRILNDLKTYLERRPNSQSTKLIVNEGFRSSLTVPLEIDGRGVGFLFFTSVNVSAFNELHVTRCLQIAPVLSLCALRHHELEKPSTVENSKKNELRNCIERARSICTSSQQSTFKSQEIDSIHRKVSLDELRPGMIFEEDIKSNKGLVLYSAGQVVDDVSELKLRRYSRSGDPVCEPLAVICANSDN